MRALALGERGHWNPPPRSRYGEAGAPEIILRRVATLHGDSPSFYIVE
jgi:hypothetical protein